MALSQRTPVPPAAQAGRDLEHLAEICLEAHAIVVREGPAELRAQLEDLLRRIADRLAHGPDTE